jgi:hypothetical protein
MSDKDEIRDLLKEIRDNQRLALQRQEEYLAIAREQMDRSRGQVQESIELQRQAIRRAKSVTRIAIPGIAVCIALIIYLMVKYIR